MQQPKIPRFKFEDLEPFEVDRSLSVMTNKLGLLTANSSQTAPEDFPQREEIDELLDSLTKTDEKAEQVKLTVISDYKYFDRNHIGSLIKNLGSTQHQSPSRRLSLTVASSPVPNSARERSRNPSSNTPYSAQHVPRRKPSVVNHLSVSRNNLKTSNISDEEVPKHSRKSESYGLTSDKRPVTSTRKPGEKKEAMSAHPPSSSATPGIDPLTPTKPVNHRVSLLKDTDINSPTSSAASPNTSFLINQDPSRTSNLYDVSLAEPIYARNATKMQDNRPKKIVNQDFSKAKGTYTINIQTFQNYTEAYLRPLVESDLKVLEPKELDLEYFEVPKKGKNYKDAWKDEDREIRNPPDPKEDDFPHISDEMGNDKTNTFAKRLFSSLIPSIIKKDDDDDDDDDASDSEENNASEEDCSPEELHERIAGHLNGQGSFEARVKEELALIGLIEKDSKIEKPYDDVTSHLKKLQAQLKDLNRYNNEKRMKLRKVASNHLAYQDYTKVIDGMDSKLEQSYTKRQSANKNRRKKNTLAPRGLPEGAAQTLDLRNRFIRGLGELFQPEDFLLPTTSIYKDIPCPRSLTKDIFPKKRPDLE